MPLRIRLPANGWKPRDYQLPLWEYLCGGGKRALAVLHRRAGKDCIGLHFSARALHQRVCNVWYCLPEFAQGRKAIWTAVNPHSGMRRIDEAFPEALRENTNDNEMFIRFKNGSTFQIIGSDRYDATVGASVGGIVYSEWALANSAAWGYHRPILAENDGWALFLTTPRGRNHAYEMAQYAAKTPGWFYQALTVNDTGAMTTAQQADALNEYVSLFGADLGRAQFEQEYLVSFNAAVLGAFYALEMMAVRSEGRVLPFEPSPNRPVHRSWDLGMRDSTAIWFFQSAGAQLRILDCYSASGASLEAYRDVIDKRYRERGWIHGNDYVPHDAKVRELGTGRTRVETMRSLGLNPMLVPDATVQDGINAVRRMLPLCVFHPRCEAGLSALELYRREWDAERKCFKPAPLHDWTSDFADSARYMALAWQPAPLRVVRVPPRQGIVIPPPDDVPMRGRIQL